MDVIFKLATSPSLMSPYFPSNFMLYEQLRTLVMGLDEIDVIFKLANIDDLNDVTLCKKCPNTDFFLVRISRIWTECEEIRSSSPYPFRIWENTDQENLHMWTLFTYC